METTRRTFLAGIAATTIPAGQACAAEIEPAAPSIDDFLSRAAPSEKARYHANALAEAMAELHPDHLWRSHIDHEHHIALTVGDRRTGGAT